MNDLMRDRDRERETERERGRDKWRCIEQAEEIDRERKRGLKGQRERRDCDRDMKTQEP